MRNSRDNRRVSIRAEDNVNRITDWQLRFVQGRGRDRPTLYHWLVFSRLTLRQQYPTEHGNYRQDSFRSSPSHYSIITVNNLAYLRVLGDLKPESRFLHCGNHQASLKTPCKSAFEAHKFVYLNLPTVILNCITIIRHNALSKEYLWLKYNSWIRC